jgi:hypothetical protein
MPNPVTRPSLTTTLDQRYATQRAGEAFDVKAVLGQPGTIPPAGEVIDAASQNGANFQSPNGFQVRVMPQISQLLAVQSNDTKGLSTYVNGLDTTRYHP